MKVLYLIVSILIVASCSSQNKDKNFSQELTEDIQNTRFYSPYCIYMLNDSDTISTSQIERLVTKILPSYNLVDSISSKIGLNEYTITHFNKPKIDYPAPSPEYLEHSGHNLDSTEINKLQDPNEAVVISFSGTNKNIKTDNIRINIIIDSLLSSSSNIVTDYTTYESFNKSSWKFDRVIPFNEKSQDFMSQYTIHLYRDGDYCRAVTLGMGKFCLPDISIEGISCNNQNSYASLINLLAQTWLENPKITIDSTAILNITKIKNDSVRNRLDNNLETNATKKGILFLKNIIPQEGDAPNTQLQIVFNSKEYSSPQEEQQELLSTIFGSTDAIKYINHDDKLLAASNKAREELPRFKKSFNNGLAPGYSLLLKAPFETDNGGTEWMWVEVTKWDNSITGILQNDPFEIEELKSGAIVSFEQNDVFDYIYYLPDGTYEGNETGKIIANNQ